MIRTGLRKRKREEMKRKSIVLLLCLALVMSLMAGCGNQTDNTKTDTPAQTQEPAKTDEPEKTPEQSQAQEPAPAEKTKVRFGVLSGPTGIGASQLLEKNANDQSLNKYEVEVLAAATDMSGQVAAGNVDIAAVPTNLASALFNKTEGGIRILALNTAGVLYILEKGDTVKSFDDLKGKTIYATGQGANPEYVLNYLLEKNGLAVGTDVKVEFMDSGELATKMAAGELDVCMLPVPAVTTVLVKNKDVRIALNLTEAWDALNTGSMLTMGCVVVNAGFAKDHPEAVENFLKEYKESIEYVKANPADAGAWCEKFGIVGAAAVATKAIPDCNLIFVAGDDIRPAIEGYYQVLFDADPKSIGGKLPADEFYTLK